MNDLRAFALGFVSICLKTVDKKGKPEYDMRCTRGNNAR